MRVDNMQSREAFKQRLMSLGQQYHIHHPVNIILNSGQASQDQVKLWVANRFYYQLSIPMKDAAIIANCPEREIRRKWLERIVYHDGHQADEGGIQAWLRLGEACGATADEMYSLKFLLPGVRFAVDAYVNFAKNAPWQEGICSSLTELFAPKIHHQRLESWPKHYPWIEDGGFQYFKNRIMQARNEAEFALNFVLDKFIEQRQQDRAIEIVKFKLDVLWAISDSLYIAFLPEKQRINAEKVHA